jgi:anti-sigma regulatory factor (Ser/Thr protein kinase)
MTSLRRRSKAGGEIEIQMIIDYPAWRSKTKGPDGNSGGGLLLRLEFQSDPSLLCAVRGTMERLTEAFGFPEPECRAVTRAVDEALTNIIRHSYKGRLDQPIEMLLCSVRRQANAEVSDGLEILLCDQGPSIEQADLCMRALEEVKPGGLGLHFIKQSMDIVEYKRTNGTNCLRLVKYVRAAKKNVNS